MTFTEFTAFPSPAQPGKDLSISAIATLTSPITRGNITIQATYQNEVVLNISTVNVCNFHPSIKCPIPAGQFKFSDMVVMPELLPGDYFFRIFVFDPRFATQSLGCVEFSTSVAPIAPATERCPIYVSHYNATVAGNSLHARTRIDQRNLGDWIQVGRYRMGPLARNDSLDFAFTSLPWGSFISVEGTEDVFGLGISDLSKYIWGLSGIMVEFADHQEGVMKHRYQGEFFVGYNDSTISLVTMDNALVYGQFDWTFSYNPKYLGFPNPERLYGTLIVNPASSMPAGWPWPLTFGRLNPQQVVQGPDGKVVISGFREYCSCEVDICGICGGDGTCPALKPEDAVSHERPGLTDAETWTIIAVVAALAIIFVILVLCFVAYNRRRRTRQVIVEKVPMISKKVKPAATSDGEPSDYIPPYADSDFDAKNKPDYGAMALDDIIRENEG